VLKKEELPVADARQSRAEAARVSARVLFLNGILVALPIFAVGRIGDEVIEEAMLVPILRQRTAEKNVLRVPPIGAFHEEV
jgi:hypothetical protein